MQEGQQRVRRKKKKKKSHRLYAAVVLTLGVVIIVMAVLILFYVQRIEIDGNSYCTDKEIAEAVQNDKLSFNSLYILGKYKLGKGKILPCMETMDVSMKKPWTICVKVNEKPIVGYVEKGEKRAYFDKDGLVVLYGEKMIGSVPFVEGMNAKKIKLYQQIETDKSNIFEKILTTTTELQKQSLSTERIVCDKDRIYAYVGNVCLSFGSEVTPEKIAHAKKIIENLKGQAGTLHLENYSAGNETITFTIEEFTEEN